MPTISVIVPVYKVEPFLHRCVDSILAQRFADFDLILVDDGSPDRCGQMCEEYAARDSRVQVIHQQNGGLSAARNTGIDWAFAHSDSQWLAFVDSDDWVHPEFLLRLYQAAEQTGCRLSACGLLRTAEGPLPEPEDAPAACLSADDYYCGGHPQGLPAVAWNKLYHKSLMEALRYPPGKLHEDEFTTYQAVYAAGQVAVIPARLYAYYQNPQGIMGSDWSPRRMDVLEAFENQIHFAQTRHLSRMLERISEQYIYSAYEQLGKARKPYTGILRKKLRWGLKLGRQCGSFPMETQKLWAYEAAYPCKPVWFLVSRLTK